MRTHKIKIAGKKIELKPLFAKEGLELIVRYGTITDVIAPYVMILMTDRSREVRSVAMAKILKEVPDLPDVIIETVYKAARLSKDYVEQNMTMSEILDAVITIARMNDFNKFWTVANNMQIIQKKSFVEYLAMANYMNGRI